MIRYMDKSLPFAQFCSVSGIESSSGTVRTIGRTTSYSPTEEQVVLEEGGSSVVVDVKLLHPFCFKHGAVVQFIGETTWLETEGPLRLLFKTYLVREMEGVNLEFYLKARKLWEESFESRSS